MELSFVTVDVFTRTRFRGNPLAVITVPPTLAAPLTYAQKLAVACEFNLSETVFIHSGPDPAVRHIDIFLTTAEIPFAGHPTIGAAVTLLPHGVTTLIAKAGPITIVKTADDAVKARIPHNVRVHARRVRDLDLPAAALSSNDAIRQAELDAPVCSIVNGMTFVLVELPSLELLAAVQASTTKFPVAELLDDGWQRGLLSRYYFVRTAPPAKADDGVTTLAIRTRMIEPTMEDPATGSAASALSSYLSISGHDQPSESLIRYEVTQGVEMGKESNIVVELAVKDSKVDQVTLAGAAVQVMQGTITI